MADTAVIKVRRVVRREARREARRGVGDVARRGEICMSSHYSTDETRTGVEMENCAQTLESRATRVRT